MPGDSRSAHQVDYQCVESLESEFPISLSWSTQAWSTWSGDCCHHLQLLTQLWAAAPTRLLPGLRASTLCDSCPGSETWAGGCPLQFQSLKLLPSLGLPPSRGSWPGSGCPSARVAAALTLSFCPAQLLPELRTPPANGSYPSSGRGQGQGCCPSPPGPARAQGT